MIRQLIRIAMPSALLALPGAAFGATVRGIVSEQGRPIVGVPVLVDGTTTFLTNMDGRFTARLPDGPHMLRVDLHGYPSQERSVTLESNGVAQADFPLEPLLQVYLVSAPVQLAHGAPGIVEVTVTNSATTDYSLDAAGLDLSVAGGNRSADFVIQADPENPTLVRAGASAMLRFTLTPTRYAPVGRFTLRATLFAFDTAFGRNLLLNGSFESEREDVPWFFATDNPPFFPAVDGAVSTVEAMTGRRCGWVDVSITRSGLVRSYWDNTARIKAGGKYVLSGYIKTERVVSSAGEGAAVYAPITGTPTYQEPITPWIIGTRDWRKAIVAFQPGNRGTKIEAHCRGQIQQGRGFACFDNFALTEGSVDASLTVTSSEQSLEVTGG